MRSLISTQGLARASSRRPWRVIGLWIALFVAGGYLAATLLGDALTTESDFTNRPESKAGADLLEERLRGPKTFSEIVVVQAAAKTVDDPAYERFVTTLHRALLALGSDVVENGRQYYQARDESLVSADRRTTILPVVMAGSLDDAEGNIDEFRAVLTAAAAGQSDFRVLTVGDASISADFKKVAEEDLQTGEIFGVAAALIILVVVFGTVAAAMMPIALAVISVVTSLGILGLIGQATNLSFFVTNMVTMMGLAVGIDYSLFIVSRYREGRRHGLNRGDAIAASGATASRAVFFSGMAVVLALFGMLLIPTTIFQSVAAGAIVVVLVSMLASLTLLPAALGLLGDKVDALRLPFPRRASPGLGTDGSRGFWDRVVYFVMRRPAMSLVVAAGLLIAAVIPYFDITTGEAGVSTLPDGLESKEAFQILDRDFSAGLVAPFEIVIDGAVDSAPVQAGIARLQDALAADPVFGEPTLEVNAARDLALVSTPVTGDRAGDVALAAVARLRAEIIPAAFDGVPAGVYLTGATAISSDFFALTDTYTPIVFAFVLGLSFILLTIMFRSVVVPLKAIVMNLLSVGAAYGLMVLVFQKGVLAGVLGFRQVDLVEAWIPLFLFSVLFGLSMDYHVFLLSRIRERFDQTHNNSEAVAFGLRSTAGIITGAALIMVAVFGGFAAGDLVGLQQVGFGLGVAVLLDATIVRSVLVPAAMQLLGTRNWYLPRWLDWLPRVQSEGGEPLAEPTAGSAAGGA